MLYRACQPLLTPPEVDQMELWQVAVFLGVDERASSGSGAAMTRPTAPEGRARNGGGSTTIRGVVFGGAPRNAVNG